MFDAYKRARDAVQAAIDTDYATTMAGVRTAHSTRTEAIRKTYRITTPANVVFPCAVIGQARGAIDDASSRSVRSVVTVPVMVAVSGKEPARLDAEMDDHITALVRLFAGTQRDGMLFTVQDFDADTPSQYSDSTLLQTGIVNVAVAVAEPVS